MPQPGLLPLTHHAHHEHDQRRPDVAQAPLLLVPVPAPHQPLALHARGRHGCRCRRARPTSRRRLLPVPAPRHRAPHHHARLRQPRQPACGQLQSNQPPPLALAALGPTRLPLSTRQAHEPPPAAAALLLKMSAPQPASLPTRHRSWSRLASRSACCSALQPSLQALLRRALPALRHSTVARGRCRRAGAPPPCRQLLPAPAHRHARCCCCSLPSLLLLLLARLAQQARKQQSHCRRLAEAPSQQPLPPLLPVLPALLLARGTTRG
jgi:hypothetical protein